MDTTRADHLDVTLPGGDDHSARLEGLALEAQGILALWEREVRVFLRERSRVVSSLAQPILWLLLLGTGFGTIANPGGYSYTDFLFPGIIGMEILFSTVFFGMYIVWDRRLDVLKEVLVSPVHRVSVFFGKVLGGSTEALIESLVLLLIGLVIAPVTPAKILPVMLIVLATAIGWTSLGLFIGSLFESPGGFQIVVTFLIFPVFLVSGALFPLTGLPTWLATLASLNPMSYSVDLLRGTILGAWTFSALRDLGVILVFDVAMILLGTWSFRRMT